MKRNVETAYITHDEAASRLNMTDDELFELVLESGRPSFIFDGRKILYAEEDVERLRSSVRQ